MHEVRFQNAVYKFLPKAVKYYFELISGLEQNMSQPSASPWEVYGLEALAKPSSKWRRLLFEAEPRSKGLWGIKDTQVEYARERVIPAKAGIHWKKYR